MNDGEKLITFLVPCYNSEKFMSDCLDTLVQANGDVEIIVVNDGSKDGTGRVADEYGAKYPDKIRVIHQENGGHGEGLNQGIRNAKGIFYKVVDSDDWLEVDAMNNLINKLKYLTESGNIPDMVLTNFIINNTKTGKKRVYSYRRLFRNEQTISWDQTPKFGFADRILIHSVTYRTKILRDVKLELPKKTFYVDHLYTTLPQKEVNKIYYYDIDLYSYTVGNQGQSIYIKNLIKNSDHNIRICRAYFDNMKDIETVKSPKLKRYFYDYISTLMVITSIYLRLAKNPEATEKKKELWKDFRENHNNLYKNSGNKFFRFFVEKDDFVRSVLSIWLYHAFMKIFKLNF